MSIPWHVLEAAGLTRDGLLAQFRTSGKFSPNLHLLDQSFMSRSVRIVTDTPSFKAREYLLRLHFAELEAKQPGDRVFDIRLQGQTVASAIDIMREAGAARRPVIKTFRVTPERDLDLEFVPRSGMPLLNGLELISSDPR